MSAALPDRLSSPGNRGTVLIAASVSSFLAPFMGSSLNIATPSIGREFGMSAVALGWIATAYLLAAAACLVPFGKLADLAGRARIFGWGSLVFALSSVLAFAAPSAAAFLIARALQGIGSAMIFSTGVAMLTAAFPPGERGRVLGINVGFTYLGLSLGPVLGGALTQGLGWRSLFVPAASLGFLLTALVAWKLREDAPASAPREPFDVAGATILAAGLVALMAGLGRLPGASGGVLAVSGLIVLGVFVVWENRVPRPVLDIGLFRGSPVFLFSNLAALIHYCATSAQVFLLSLFLQYIKELSPQEAGLILLAQPAMMALFSPLAGRLSDRIEPRLLASTGMGVSVLGLALMSRLGAETSLAVIVAELLLLGFGFALFSSPNTNAVMGAVERRSYGVASAMLGTMRLTGQMLSMGLAMLVFALVIGRVSITPEVYPRFLTATRGAFTLFAGLCLAGVFASLARGRIHAPPAAGAKTGEKT